MRRRREVVRVCDMEMTEVVTPWPCTAASCPRWIAIPIGSGCRAA